MKLSYLILAGTVLIACFVSGVLVANDRWARVYAEYQAEAERQKAEELESLKEKNQAISQKIVKAFSQQAKEKDEIKKRFDLYVSELSSNGVLDNKGSSSDGQDVPDNAEATAGLAGESKAQCPTKDLRDLKTALMQLAKEHDELAVRYNTLLEIYEKSREVVNNGS